jgi:hypothetical protein
MSDPGRAITTATGESASNLREMDFAEVSLQASGGSASSTEVAGYGLARRLPLTQRSVLVRKVASLERRLFDEDGETSGVGLPTSASAPQLVIATFLVRGEPANG